MESGLKPEGINPWSTSLAHPEAERKASAVYGAYMRTNSRFTLLTRPSIGFNSSKRAPEPFSDEFCIECGNREMTALFTRGLSKEARCAHLMRLFYEHRN